ncbi:hypothetical protein HPHPH11_0134 [Helicobacter pylori Hp H-11]|nr:hypothetical protein HPHPH11_0134 [Helicobacter pylori Hp H-11]
MGRYFFNLFIQFFNLVFSVCKIKSFKGVCCKISSRPIVAIWGKPP